MLDTKNVGNTNQAFYYLFTNNRGVFSTRNKYGLSLEELMGTDKVHGKYPRSQSQSTKMVGPNSLFPGHKNQPNASQC